MYLLTFGKQILHEMWLKKLRSTLALFSIFWGTTTVILLLAIGSGFHQASLHNILQLAEGSFFCLPGITSKSYQGFPKGMRIKINPNTIVNLPKTIPNVSMSSPILISDNVLIRSKNNGSKKLVFGTTPNLQIIRKIHLKQGGRFLNTTDIQSSKHVVIIGDKVKQYFFKDTTALGKTIFIKQIPFTIIGVILKSSKNAHNWYDNNLIIPYTTHQQLWGRQNIIYFIVLSNSMAQSHNIKANLKYYFSSKYHFDPNDEDALHIFDTTKIFRFFKWFFIAIQIFLGACGGLTLSVGAIGIANIMFLIVTERTKEIGIRMAVGATRTDVLLQILLEALTITSLGGILGFLASIITVNILHYISLPNWLGTPTISVTSIIITIIVLITLGTLAGYFPARRAARMDPIDALRSN